MQSLAYMLDGRTIRRVVSHMAPAIALGVYLAAHYESLILQATMFGIPVAGMYVALVRGRDTALATVIALAEFRDATDATVASATEELMSAQA